MTASVGKYTLYELARLCGARLHGDGSTVIHGVAPITGATKNHISFIESRRFLPHNLTLIRAGALVVHPSIAGKLEGFSLLISNTPKATFAKIAQIFHGVGPAMPPGIHPLTWIAPGATIEPDLSIGPFVTIGPGSTVGRKSRIMGHCYIGSNVIIGAECLIYPGVTILDGCKIGNRVIVHSGTVIGSDGFGYAQDESGEHVKIPQTGIVVIEDDVEIGANCTIDRATFGETIIRRGSKIDNLVTVAHNVIIGERCIIAGQAGVAGSSTLGKGVIIGGQVGIADHITIGDGVRIGAKSGVASNIKDHLDVVGIPALSKEETLRLHRNLRYIERLRKKVEDLEKAVNELITGSQR